VRGRLIPVSDREARLDEARTAYGRNDWIVARSRLLDADAHDERTVRLDGILMIVDDDRQAEEIAVALRDAGHNVVVRPRRT
jgi:hypothetical protein